MITVTGVIQQPEGATICGPSKCRLDRLELLILKCMKNSITTTQLTCTCDHSSASDSKKGNDVRASAGFVVLSTNGLALAAPLALVRWPPVAKLELFMY